MKVYIDVLILINFLFDFLLLLGVKIILKRKTAFARLILSSIFGEISCLLLFLPLSNISILLSKLLISIFLIIIAFGYKDYNYFKKNILYFYILSVILGGIIYFLKFTFINKQDIFMNLIILLIIGPYLYFNYLKEQKNYKSNYTLRYDLAVYLNNKKYTYTAYLDTGNKLEDPYKKRPIILVNDDRLQFAYENSILVPYRTLDNEGIIKCQKADKVVIDDKYVVRNVLIGKSVKKFDIEGVDVILPNIFKEEIND